VAEDLSDELWQAMVDVMAEEAAAIRREQAKVKR